MSEDKKQISIIKKSNQAMIAYFSNQYSDCIDEIQRLKSELFEVNIRLDELKRTKKLYGINTNSHRNVFSPIVSSPSDNEKETTILSKLESLTEIQHNLEDELEEQEAILKVLNKKLVELQDSASAIEQLEKTLAEKDRQIEDLDHQLQDAWEEDEGFVFNDEEIAEEAIASEEQKKKDFIQHGINILMIDSFNKTYIATMLDHKIKEALKLDQSNLQYISSILESDPKHAKELLYDMVYAQLQTAASVEVLLEKLNYNYDNEKPILDQIENYILSVRENHPEIVLYPEIAIASSDMKIDFVKSISLLNLLSIFFDNIFRHANATQIHFNFSIEENVLEVGITDNGKGISNDYYTKAPWYSSLHRAHEIIYLLDGNLVVTGQEKIGTSVRFSFTL